MRPKPVHVPGAGLAEREVVAHDQGAKVDGDQQALHELLRGERRQAPRELQDDRLLHPQLLNEAQPLLEGRDLGRAVRGVEHTAGVGIEGDPGDAELLRAGGSQQALEDRAVSEVHAVEAAHRQCRRA